MPDTRLAGTHIRLPGAIGVAYGVAVSLGIGALGASSPGESHAVLLAAIATPYSVFALPDGSWRSIIVEGVAVVGFVVAACSYWTPRLFWLQWPWWPTPGGI